MCSVSILSLRNEFPLRDSARRSWIGCNAQRTPRRIVLVCSRLRRLSRPRFNGQVPTDRNHTLTRCWSFYSFFVVLNYRVREPIEMLGTDEVSYTLVGKVRADIRKWSRFKQ